MIDDKFEHGQQSIDALNERIADEFRRCEVEYRDDDRRPVLWVEYDDRNQQLVLCDYNSRVLIDEQDAADSGIEQAAREWIDATA